MSNRVTLEQLDRMTDKEALSLHVSQLTLLLEDVAVLGATHKRLKDRLNAAINERYEARAKEMRRMKGLDEGTVHVEDDEYIVSSSLSLTYKWDEKMLAKIETDLAGRVDDVSEYIKVKRDVEKGKFKKWPSDLTRMFSPALTMKPGSPTYDIKHKEG